LLTSAAHTPPRAEELAGRGVGVARRRLARNREKAREGLIPASVVGVLGKIPW